MTIYLAPAGQKISKARLKNVFVIRKDSINIGISHGAPVKHLHAGSNEMQNIQEPKLQKNQTYEEETAEVISQKLEQLTFEPYAKIKLALRTNVHQVKEIYQKNIIDNVVYLNSKNNEKVSTTIADYLDNLLDNHLYAADYIDMINSIRTKDNYLTFAHATASAFYSIAIAKKLFMMQDDLLIKKNVGKWLSIKTSRHNKPMTPYSFSVQLLKYIDNQKDCLAVKFNNDISKILIENLHDLMHEYGEMKLEKYPSLCVQLSKPARIAIGMAALNIDIGKLCIPETILNKTDSLSSEEFEIMKGHPVFSVKKLKEVDVANTRVLSFILFHHVLGPGRGYPEVTQPTPVESKIIALADIYDAMRSPRFYKKPCSQSEALAHLEDLHQHGFFDKALYLAARHTFNEFNHEYVTERVKKSVE